MREGATLGSSAVAQALNVEADGDDSSSGEINPEDITDRYAAAKFDEDDTKLKEIDLSMKQISDQIQNDITK